MRGARSSGTLAASPDARAGARHTGRRDVDQLAGFIIHRLGGSKGREAGRRPLRWSGLRPRAPRVDPDVVGEAYNFFLVVMIGPNFCGCSSVLDVPGRAS